MATDHSHSARKGLVTRLKANVGITAIVGERVYGEKLPANPQYPYVRVGLMIPRPYGPTCVSGMSATFNIDCTSSGVDASEAYRLSRIVVDDLHEEEFPLSDDAHVLTLDWTGTTPRQEDKLWRMMVGFQLTTQQAE